MSSSEGEKFKSDKEKLRKIIEILEIEYPSVKIQLEFNDEFQLLVATILSAQCTDDRVNIVTRTLFKKYKTIEDFANAELEELEQYIFSTGYYKSKAKKIKSSAHYLLEKHKGKIPSEIEELLKIPGVGRKTANVLLNVLFNKPAIVVDTHVIKISNRLGVVDTRNPDKIERELMKLVDKDKWINFTFYFINHGRKVCKARSPLCGICVIRQFCEQKGVKVRG